MSYGIPSHLIVAYDYASSRHCVACAIKAYADRRLGDADVNGIPFVATDFEGNELHPVFSDDCDIDTIASCDDCRKVVCLVCGDVAETRLRGAVKLKCWNCKTSYRTEH